MAQNNPIVASVSVGTSAVLLAVGATSRPGRRNLYVYNAGTGTVYLGPSTVTSSNGFGLAPSATFIWDSEDDLYAISASGSNNVRVMETI